MVMEFLPPRDEEGVSYCYWSEKPGIKSWAAFILKNPSGLYAILEFTLACQFRSLLFTQEIYAKEETFAISSPSTL
jgi:hypothetical protein